MTTETNSVLNTVKEAFAPVTEAFTKLQNLEVPEAAREFVKKQAETAKVRAADMHAGSEKVTAAIETAVAGSVPRPPRSAATSSRLSIRRGSVLRRHRQARFGQVAERSRPDPVGHGPCAWRSVRLAAKSTTNISASSSPRGKNAQDNFAKVYPRPPDRDPLTTHFEARLGGPSFCRACVPRMLRNARACGVVSC